MDAKDFLKAATSVKKATGGKTHSMKAVEAEFKRMHAKRG